MTKFCALEAAENAVWAMEPEALEKLLTIAAREHDITPEALEAYQAKALANAEQATVRNGVAIIAANGPLFKRGNLFTAISGATSYDIMRRDLQAAVNDSKVKAAILNLDTPGGEASGANELAAYVYSLRGKFPVIAYVNGMAASAGYWIASAAEEIVVDATAILGSIGVQMAMRKSEDPKGTTSFRFVSSQSPMKNADPGTEEGAAHIQGVVDAMAQVFVNTVALHRGRSIQTVLSQFGKGGIFVGQDAVSAGLADRIGNFEGVLAELSAPRRAAKAKGATMADETYTSEQFSAAVQSEVSSSSARTASIAEIGANLGASGADIATAITAGTDPAAFALDQSRKFAERTTAATQSEADEVQAIVDRINNSDRVPKALQTDQQAAAAAATAASMSEERAANTVDAVAARINAA